MCKLLHSRVQKCTFFLLFFYYYCYYVCRTEDSNCSDVDQVALPVLFPQDVPDDDDDVELKVLRRRANARRFYRSFLYVGLFSVIGGSCHKYHFCVCRDKSKLVATKLCLSRQKFCRDKHTSVATKARAAIKMILAAAPADNN